MTKRSVFEEELYTAIFTLSTVFTFISYYLIDHASFGSSIGHAFIVGFSSVTLGVLYRYADKKLNK